MDCAVRSSEGANHGGGPGIASAVIDKPPPEVMLVGGTRPEAIKLAPIVEAIRARGRMCPVLVASGQHESMFEQALAAFGMRPDIRLRIARPTGSQPELLGELLRALDEQLAGRRPATVVVQGDTTTTLAAALAAFWRKVPVVHVEAGLRSHELSTPFPEEANRKIVTQISSLHLAPTTLAVRNLREEGVAGSNVLLTGNTVVDAVLSAAKIPAAYTDFRLPAVERRARTGQSRLLLVTVHRRESSGLGLAGILAGLRTVLEHHRDAELVLPVHPNPDIRTQVTAGLSGVERVHLTAPLHYGEFCRLLSCASLVLSDSGGIQEEAPSFGIPVVVLRTVTERMEAVEAGCSVLAGTDPQAISNLAARLLCEAQDPPRSTPANPFGDGQAGRRAEQAIARLLGLISAADAESPLPGTAEGAKCAR